MQCRRGWWQYIERQWGLQYLGQCYECIGSSLRSVWWGILSRIESIFAIEVPWDDRHQHIPRCYCNSGTMATKVKCQ